MSTAPYTVTPNPAYPGEIGQIIDATGIPVVWNDAGFQAWNNAQAVPFTLSERQQAILQARSITFLQFQNLIATWPPPKAVQWVLYQVCKSALNNEIV